MKVLHLISGGDTGGAKTHIIALLKGLNKLIDANVICFLEDTFYEDAKEAGINIKVFKQKSRSDMSVVKRLVDEIDKESYDIIHCHGARANFIAMFLKRKVKRPLVTTIHSDYKLDFKDNVYKKFVFTTLNTIALKIFDSYIAISDTFKEMLVQRGFKKDKIYVAYNGIDLDVIPELETKEEFLKNFNIDHEGKIIVGIVGRLDLVKDHETFIKAANIVLKKNKNILFLIAGDGNEEQRLKEIVKEFKIEKDVRFLGFVKKPYSFFNAIDVNVLSSVSESFPYVILEGARMKRTVISTQVGGVSKLIKDDYNGFLIPVGDENALAEKINILYNDPEKIRIMGENLYKDVEANFSSDSMAEQHVKIYKEITHKWRKV